MHSNTSLAFIIEAVPALIGYVDADERYRFNNTAYELWFGRPASEISGRHIREVLGDAVYAAIMPHVRAALGGHRVTFDSTMKYSDGKSRHVRATYVPDVGPDGRVQGFVAHVHDITDLKRAEEERERLRRHADELVHVARRLSESLDIAQVAEQIARSVLPLFEAQSSVVRLLEPDGSLACAAIAGKWLDNFQPGYRLPPGVGLVGRAVAERRALWTPDILREPSVVLTAEFRRGLAGAGHHAVLAVPLQVKGEVIGAISTAHREIRTFSQADIDLLQAFADQAALAIRTVQLFAREQAARAEAEAANRAKDEFLALLAHELRNPLSPIVTGLELFRQAGIETDALKRVHSSMERQTQHLVRLVDDLLDVSRVSQGKIDLRSERLDLSPLLRQALDSVRPLIEERKHELSCEEVDRGLFVDADAVRLVQVIANLLNNAARYTDSGGQIRLTAARDGDDAVIRIADNGRGISAEMLDRIFEMFVQEREGGKGLGLGLTLVRQLVELHGGRVRAYSQGRGKGSEFVVRLPLAAAGGAEEAAAAEDADHDVCEGLSVIVIEDEEDIRQAMQALLESWGFTVQVAEDGDRGVEMILDGRPDVALVDIAMPGIDGYTVARRVRSKLGASAPRLVALTGFGREEDRKRAREAGFDTHLIKPAAPRDLRRALRGG